MPLNTFDEARMHALKAYAKLEYELCLLFKGILGTEAQVASAIFYQISNTRARYAIIGSLLQISHDETFRKSWKKVECWLIPRDTARNHIVHWGQETHLMVQVYENGADGLLDKRIYEKEDEILTNNVRRWRAVNPDAQAYSEADLKAETKAAETMKQIVNRFNLAVHFPDRCPWTDIFQQPITDPTPEEFLSRLNDRGLPSLPGSLAE